MNDVLKVENLKKTYTLGGNLIHAVNGVSFSIHDGQTVGLVGESGCGKSTTARCILRILEATSGSIYFRGKDISAMRQSKFLPYREKIQMVFQDASTSLNPRMSIRQLLSEPLKLFKLAHGERAAEKLREVISLVALEQIHLERYPHQLSGGQQQRVAIARALITQPELIVLDEPTASQDAAVKVLLVALLEDLQKKFGFSYLFVSHDLSIVRNLCHRVIVMYLGLIVEEGPVDIIFNNPSHPYTKALLSAIPVPIPGVRKEKIRLQGETPSVTKVMEGCSLKERCVYAKPICFEESPELLMISTEHSVACHFAKT